MPTHDALELRNELQITVSNKMKFLCGSMCIISTGLFTLLPSSLPATWMISLICNRSIKKPLEESMDLYREFRVFQKAPVEVAWATVGRAVHAPRHIVRPTALVNGAPWSCAMTCLSLWDDSSQLGGYTHFFKKI